MRAATKLEGDFTVGTIQVNAKHTAGSGGHRGIGTRK